MDLILGATNFGPTDNVRDWWQSLSSCRRTIERARLINKLGWLVFFCFWWCFCCLSSVSALFCIYIVPLPYTHVESKHVLEEQDPPSNERPADSWKWIVLQLPWPQFQFKPPSRHFRQLPTRISSSSIDRREKNSQIDGQKSSVPLSGCNL